MELRPILGYHAVLFIAHTAAYIYDCKYIVTNETETVFTYKGYGGKFKYLTNWNFVSPNIPMYSCLVHKMFMYTSSVLSCVFGTCKSCLLKRNAVLHGRMNLGLNSVRCTEKDQYCNASCEGISAHRLFSCFLGYIIYGTVAKAA